MEQIIVENLLKKEFKAKTLRIHMLYRLCSSAALLNFKQNDKLKLFLSFEDL